MKRFGIGIFSVLFLAGTAWAVESHFFNIQTPLKLVEPVLALGEGIDPVPYEPGSEPGDLDCDGILDNEDEDNDGDGIPDIDDADDDNDGCPDVPSPPGEPDCVPTCFVGGTQVLLETGETTSINRVQVGQPVLSVNETTGETIATRVTRVIAHPSRLYDIYRLAYSEGNAIEVTGEHSVFEMTSGEFVTVVDLANRFSAGGPVELRLADGSGVAVTSVGLSQREIPVYNIHVSGTGAGQGHNYFANGVLVHNSGEGKLVPCDPVDNSNTNEDAGTK